MSLSMSLPETKVSASKFDGKKFSLWKMKIIAYLDSMECLDVIENPTSDAGFTKVKSDHQEEKWISVLNVKRFIRH